MIQFSKPVMKTSEIVEETGLKKRVLIDLYHLPGQKYAWKMPGGNMLYFDTAELAKYLEAQKARENRGRRR